jgi:eukaryotic-like serine/threonine-protein kinase
MPKTRQTELPTASAVVPAQRGDTGEAQAMPGESGSGSFHPASGRRIPWWMAAIGLSYITTCCFIFYLIFRGPGALSGFVSTFSGDAMVVRSVDTGSHVATGGLRPGDRVVMIDNRAVRTVRDWTEATGNLQVSHRQRWLVFRKDERITLDIVPIRTGFQSKLLDEGYIQYLSLLLTGLLVGFLIAWKRPADSVGRVGAWFILTASIAFGFPVGWAALWRGLPFPLQWMLWIPQLSRFVLEAIFLSFFMLFPHRFLVRRWVWFAIWAPVLATLPWRIKAFYAVIHPGLISTVPTWILTAGFARTIVYLFIGAVILVVSYRRFLDINAKRRVRFLILGMVISLIAAAAMVWIDTFAGRMSGITVVLYIIAPFFCACPLCFAYAILRHRVLDISIIIRQGLQYVLARGAVIGLIPVLGGLFILDLAANSQERLVDIVRNRGWVYMGVAGLAFLAYWKRREWLKSIDRRFFRERYNAQRILQAVVEDLREARSFEKVAPHVVSQVEAAMHPEFAAILMRKPGETQYGILAGRETAPPPINADSKLVALLRLLGKPVEISQNQTGWLNSRLPPQEFAFLRQSRLEWLFPICLVEGEKEALLALGPKRSEVPYSQEDQQLLQGIASSLALLLEQSPLTTLVHEGSEECPQCGTCYDTGSGICKKEGATLIPLAVSRLLGHRYRLDRRLGEGGMGTVYEAYDQELEREVAVKLIRLDLAASAVAAARFRREAKAAASFSHPNVVTVYDYGVAQDQRAYLVMELLRGVTLRQELSRSGRLPSARAVQILHGVCSAVDAAHRQRLIHRDLKPENIFLVKAANDETAKILDFGVVKPIAPADAVPIEAETGSGVLVGTLKYMSPEQLRGENPAESWDLWALTVVAYEMLAGAHPFAGSTTMDLYRAIIEGKAIPLKKRLPEAPSGWQEFFDHALSIKVDPRPDSALQLFSQFSRIAR